MLIYSAFESSKEATKIYSKFNINFCFSNFRQGLTTSVKSENLSLLVTSVTGDKVSGVLELKKIIKNTGNEQTSFG